MIRQPNRVVSRNEARERRLTWYFTGKPCVHGHVATRNFNNNTCHGCKRKEPTAVVSDKQRRVEFHEQWMTEHRAARAKRIAIGKMLS